ncbi:hypothetical protein [Bacillus cereus group sp. TH152-1LC]|uniref:hypothetical protein n=1 Tax=Bacillus cereus group sp. TH152-1LC TaxID=3018060 RepID=UPI0022E26EE0|nr:hypothetical protein [Bacillus cereus group sp. TH152-1LC]MDA1675508.1 hypothetical protein [Bacillus cereus group sp. TH152-1LC]
MYLECCSIVAVAGMASVLIRNYFKEDEFLRKEQVIDSVKKEIPVFMNSKTTEIQQLANHLKVVVTLIEKNQIEYCSVVSNLLANEVAAIKHGIQNLKAFSDIDDRKLVKNNLITFTKEVNAKFASVVSSNR